MLTPKQRKTIHAERKTLFCESVEKAKKREKEFQKDYETSIHTCNGGENDGRVFLHLIKK